MPLGTEEGTVDGLSHRQGLPILADPSVDFVNGDCPRPPVMPRPRRTAKYRLDGRKGLASIVSSWSAVHSAAAGAGDPKSILRITLRYFVSNDTKRR